MAEMPKAYDPSAHESAIRSLWQESGYFTPENLPGKRTESFTIVMPPPNVTGTLHLGHAVMLAVEDLMIRFERMRGKRVLWIPGTDHAAIATQTKVEKLILEKEKKSRHDLGREEFLKRVEAFAVKSHDTIVNQVRMMGSSCDWSREAYTLDEKRGEAVNEAFRQLYDMGLLYRGNRVINWCPRCASTLADDEVEYKEGETTLYAFRYVKDFPIVIATTRPETKVGDTAVAVHPEDVRYTKLIGQEIRADFLSVPLTLKIVGHRAVDAAFGTGALGVTPAHSQVDEQIARENELPALQVIGEDGNMTALAGPYAGLPVIEARSRIVADLKKAGLIEKEETVAQNLSVCYRCGTPVEPLPKLQWFIAVNAHFPFAQSKRHPIQGIKDGQEVTLKEVMSHVVKTGQIKIIPERFEKIYFHWIDNLRDWCVSRQIWFGHRIPVWYHSEKKGDDTYAVGAPQKGAGWQQDGDTLDTWFSSGLWTFSTLGWPDEKAKDLATYHPTSVLETGYDILFFWIARMVLMSVALRGEVPFKEVYLHGLVRDEQGRKMSKSLGNIIDPLDMIAKYGTDAVRLSLVVGATPGNDMRLSEEKVAGFRNFTNKLWNIGRYVLTTTSGETPEDPPVPKTLADRWILSRLAVTQEKVTACLGMHQFSAAGEALRDFTWSDFADWYLEISKVQKKDGDAERTDAILRFTLATLLKLWHPFMPFVTETLWSEMHRVGPIHGSPLLVAAWPEHIGLEDVIAEREMRRMQDVVAAIRNLRSEHKLNPKQEIEVNLAAGSERELFIQNAAAVSDLVNACCVSFDDREKKPEEVAAVSGAVQIYVFLPAVGDEKSAAKLTARAEELEKYIALIEAKLANEEFTGKAPPAVIEKEKGKRVAAAEELEKIRKQLG